MVDQLDCPCYAEIQKLWWINWNVRAVQTCKCYAGSIAVSILCRNTKAMLYQLECPLSMLCRNTKDMVDQLEMSVQYRNTKAMVDQLHCPMSMLCRNTTAVVDQLECPCYAEIQKIWWINCIVHAMQKYKSCGGSIGLSMVCRNTKDMVDQLDCPCCTEIQKLWWINWIVRASSGSFCMLKGNFLKVISCK